MYINLGLDDLIIKTINHWLLTDRLCFLNAAILNTYETVEIRDDNRSRS